MVYLHGMFTHIYVHTVTETAAGMKAKAMFDTAELVDVLLYYIIRYEQCDS